MLQTVCSSCVGNPALQEMIAGTPGGVDPYGDLAVCSACGTEGITIPFEELAQWVDGIYRASYTGVPEESDEGRSVSDILSDSLQAVPEVVSELVALGASRESDADSTQRMYDVGAKYQLTEPDPSAAFASWDIFDERVRHQTRYFDPSAERRLAELLGTAEEIATAFTNAPIRVIGPDTTLFRARVARDEREAVRFLGQPERELGPPPAPEATAGRMNPAGISVFYGATDPETAIAEIRPVVGATVVVAEFNPTRELRLLDLAALRGAMPAVSMFDSRFPERLVRLQFLREFEHIISKPLGHGEPDIDYVSTQIVSEYVRNVLDLAGIVYRSSQVGTSGENVVLFPESASVDGGGLNRFGLDPALKLRPGSLTPVVVQSVNVVYTEREDLTLDGYERVAEVLPQLTRRWNENQIQAIPIMLSEEEPDARRMSAGLRLLSAQYTIVASIRAVTLGTSGDLKQALERIADNYAERWAILQRIVEAITWGWDEAVEEAAADYREISNPEALLPMMTAFFELPAIREGLEASGLTIEEVMAAIMPPPITGV